MAESEEELKSLLMRVKEESEKAGLKLNIFSKESEVLSLLLCVQPLKDDHMRTQQEGGCLSQEKSSHQKTML